MEVDSGSCYNLCKIQGRISPSFAATYRPMPGLPFVLQPDASSMGIAAVLSQTSHDGQDASSATLVRDSTKPSLSIMSRSMSV